VRRPDVHRDAKVGEARRRIAQRLLGAVGEGGKEVPQEVGLRNFGQVAPLKWIARGRPSLQTVLVMDLSIEVREDEHRAAARRLLGARARPGAREATCEPLPARSISKT
jgi:hypothetical protein